MNHKKKSLLSKKHHYLNQTFAINITEPQICISGKISPIICYFQKTNHHYFNLEPWPLTNNILHSKDEQIVYSMGRNICQQRRTAHNQIQGYFQTGILVIQKPEPELTRYYPFPRGRHKSAFWMELIPSFLFVNIMRIIKAHNFYFLWLTTTQQE